METRKWNRPLPESFVLGGEERFSSDHSHTNQGWVLRQTSDSPSAHGVELLQEIPGWKFRFFPRFRELDQPCSEIGQVPIIDSFSWNWIDFRYKMLGDLEVRSIIWTHDSGVICTESRIYNPSDHKRALFLDIMCFLQSHGTGNQITLEKFNGRPVLTGRYGDQNLTLFMTGNPEFREDPFPYLQNELTLLPQSEKKVQWICVRSGSIRSGIEMVEKVLQLDWAGEISRRKVSHQSQIEITTGDPDWDFVLAHSQKQALVLYGQINARDDQIAPPDQELTAIQALMLLQSLENLTPQIVKNILDRIFANDNLLVTWGVGSDQDQTPPLLIAELLWQINQFGYSSEIWSIYLDTASKWLKAWFSPGLDRDRDGIPELVNPRILELPGSQTAADMVPARLLLPYPYLESPGLAALLLNDLCKMDDLLQISGLDPDTQIQERIENIQEYIQNSWDSEEGEFRNRDSQSHSSVDGFSIIESLQPGLNIIKKSFPKPSRIEIQHHRSPGANPPGEFNIICHGLDRRGNSRIEELHSVNSVWGEGYARVISESIFSKLDHCFLDGPDQYSKISMIVPSTSSRDITQTLPIWAEALSNERNQEIMDRLVLDPDRYCSPYGFISDLDAEEASVVIFWNLLLGQSLLKLGRNGTAAELVKSWMKLIVPNLVGSGSSFPGYGVITGKGLGRKDCIESLFPVRFFLQVLGIEVFGDNTITITGKNPFPWPVTLRYRGYQITQGLDNTTVTRPGKEGLTLKDPDRYQLQID